MQEKMCQSLHEHWFALKLPHLIIFLLLVNGSYQARAHVFVYGGCSQAKYQPNSPFQPNLNSLLSSMATSSSQSSYNSFAIGNSSSLPPDAAVYGLYQCRGDLSIPDCASCIENAIGQLGLLCVNGYAAGLQLDGCYVRYDNTDFLGKLDTTLVYNKCSPSSSSDSDFFRRRDDILADLQAGVGFRVRSLGMVEGFAQCLGDLSSVDCSSCLTEAVGKLKNICGSSVAADVYLAQCYARYWASGYYAPSVGSTNADEVGKTVAIIVGVLTGVALFIVLLSFLRKAFG